jgi:hypothetical protein
VLLDIRKLGLFEKRLNASALLQSQQQSSKHWKAVRVYAAPVAVPLVAS